MKQFVYYAAAALLLFACTPEENNTSEANLAPSVTVEAKNVSAISAVLVGKANLGSTVAADLQVGFQYSKSPKVTRIPARATKCNRKGPLQ